MHHGLASIYSFGLNVDCTDKVKLPVLPIIMTMFCILYIAGIRTTECTLSRELFSYIGDKYKLNIMENMYLSLTNASGFAISLRKKRFLSP